MNDAPQQNASAISPGEKPLFHSRREIALMKDTSLKPGFGLLSLGTVLAACTVDELMTPTPLTAAPITGNLDPAFVRILADVAATATTCTVSEADAAKFRVGDNIAIAQNDPTFEDLGAITAISAAVAGVVTITFTTGVTMADATVAKFSSVYHVTRAATPFFASVCVLDQNRDSGTSATDQPAPCNVVFGNAIMYTVNMTGLTTESKLALSARQHGVHTII